MIFSGTLIENILIYKNLTINAVGNNITIQAADSSQPVITINSGGNGSIIRGLNIMVV